MRQARFLHGGLLLVLAGWIGSAAGCTQYHYYGAVPPCPPGMAAPVQAGSVCDVPPSSGGSAVAQNGTRSSAVGTAPRVVVSEPGGSRFPWRRSDPDTPIVSTKVEGGVATDDSTLVR